MEWKDGSFDWIELKDLKQSYPVELAEYALQNNIQNEPAFVWWIPYTLRKRQCTISKLESKCWDKSHKYGFRIPKSVQEAFQIDNEEGNNSWRQTIEEEMKKIIDAFDKFDDGPNDLVGYQQITTHLILTPNLVKTSEGKAD